MYGKVHKSGFLLTFKKEISSKIFMQTFRDILTHTANAAQVQY